MENKADKYWSQVMCALCKLGKDECPYKTIEQCVNEVAICIHRYDEKLDNENEVIEEPQKKKTNMIDEARGMAAIRKLIVNCNIEILDYYWTDLIHFIGIDEDGELHFIHACLCDQEFDDSNSLKKELPTIENDASKWLSNNIEHLYEKGYNDSRIHFDKVSIRQINDNRGFARIVWDCLNS